MNILKTVKGFGIDPQDARQGELHFANPKLAKEVFNVPFALTSDEACKRIGRLLSMAGEKQQKLDRDGAAGDCKRILGEVKQFGCIRPGQGGSCSGLT